MNREDIIRMAQEAKMPFYWCTGEIPYLERLERFAEIVAAAKEQEMLERIRHIIVQAQERGTAAEREACADLCEDTTQEYEQYTGQPLPLNYTCAAAIRARGQA